jgi:hypothetical protein
MQYRLISPDGFDFEQQTYSSKKECRRVFNERILTRYQRQGFYSSSYGRIELEFLWDSCSIEPTQKYYIFSVRDKFVTGINLHGFGLISYGKRTKAMRVREKDIDFVSSCLLKENLAHLIEQTHYVPKNTLLKRNEKKNVI